MLMEDKHTAFNIYRVDAGPGISEDQGTCPRFSTCIGGLAKLYGNDTHCLHSFQMLETQPL
jgi:hypothetical protein